VIWQRWKSEGCGAGRRPKTPDTTHCDRLNIGSPHLHPPLSLLRISTGFRSAKRKTLENKMKINQRMRSLAIGLSLALATVAVVPLAMAGSMDSMSMSKSVMVGGAAMYPSKNIIQNAVNSKDHTTLVAAVKAAGLVDTLSSKGPFTLFAPTNEAFAALPAGTVENLVKPENKATLTKILTYHVVAGRMTSHDLAKAVADGGGKAVVKTVEGDSLTVSKDGDRLAITDDKGNVAHVTIGDVIQSNGVIHVIDNVLMP
jgi:uncharacterized surface protein with fasciclin (FAS1) repeats